MNPNRFQYLFRELLRLGYSYEQAKQAIEANFNVHLDNGSVIN
jgi:hypothetical protein